VPGIVGGELSSSDDKSFGGGDLRTAGSKETGSVIEVGPRRLSLESSDVNRRSSVSSPHSWHMSNISLASGAVLLARFA